MDLESSRLRIDHGNGDKGRVVPVGEEALAWLAESARARWVFLGYQDRPMSRTNLIHVVPARPSIYQNVSTFPNLNPRTRAITNVTSATGVGRRFRQRPALPQRGPGGARVVNRRIQGNGTALQIFFSLIY